MEKTRFYNREDLKAKDVARLISIWEGEAGESFTDYCNFSREADKNFLLFLAEKYPILYEEIEKDSSRWNGYKVGDKTNAFYSPEDVIAIAKEVCKARFLGNWKLKIVDYSGKDLDSEILISEL